MNNIGKKIYIIIPIFNMEKYLDRCLCSILANSFKDFIIICINDGSTDHSEEIIKRYQEKDNRIILINQDNQGVSAARNRGMNYINEKEDCYITFIDPDDWVHPQLLETLYHASIETEACLSGCGWCRKSVEDSNYEHLKGVKALPLSIKEISQHKYMKTLICGKLFSFAAIGNLRFNENISFSEDKIFDLSFLAQNEKATFTYNNFPLYYYYDRPGSLAHTASPKSYFDTAFVLFQKMKENTTPISTGLFCEAAIKMILIMRFIIIASNYEGISKKKYNQILYNCIKVLPHTHLPIKQQVILTLFSIFPSLYRFYRIHTDKTMLDWERTLRKDKKRE